MCTVIVLRRPGHPWPLLLAANRDEMADRPWDPPGRHWPGRPGTRAGRDRLAGGTWLGLNDAGVVAGILNRRHSLGPAPGMASRGELPLRALDAADAQEAVANVRAAVAEAPYRPFNMVIADAAAGFWLRHTDDGVTEHFALPDNLGMVTAYDLNDPASPRAARFLPRFTAAPVPDPAAGDWTAWTDLLGSRDHAAWAGPDGALCVVRGDAFGTVSSSLVALPAPGGEAAPVFLFAPGRPGEAAYAPVTA
ncbi:MAG: NRDE family protein [Hyphomicrobiales bacterium]|nr:NRDE family protein [Hyphomicrobiales bacterium]MCP5372444.1 NRDE family protein [Hyphomicrobiales bacterium]